MFYIGECGICVSILYAGPPLQASPEAAATGQLSAETSEG